ncbi:MAG: type II toxin-antitoxin system HicA family toxin [Bacteroidales bacterium]|nr:type II toxin-antitoxin system HicA family toxin [Bacteroidales bacterium]
MKYSELKRLLKDGGCFVIRQGGNHEIWFSPITSHTFPVCRHDSTEVYIITL